MGLTRLALNRPVFIFVLMLLAVLLGFISYNSMRKEEMPDVTFGAISVSTTYPGAGPDEVNTLVSRKVEEAISGVEGLRELTSNSQEGFSLVMASFEIGTNMDAALNDVRAKVDAVQNQLPDQVLKPTINKFDSNSDPMMYMVLRSDKLASRELRDLADDKFTDLFARIPGVAQVSVAGGELREIQVQLSKDRLVSLGVGIVDVQNAILQSNLNVPSGHMQSGDQEFAIRVLGEYKDVADIGDTVLAIKNPNTQGGRPTLVRLRDVATIADTSAERRQWSRLNGSDSIVLVVAKTRDGNAMEISQAAHKVIGQIEQQYGVHTIVTSDASERISESLFDMNFALMFGILLVSLIVFIFLHNMRGMLIVASAIPVCIFSAFVALNVMGFTINMMSMLALSLAIGVLVDDAIVVLENIYRHLKMGEDPVDAAINGRSEIGLAAIAITLADVVVFVPIAYMGGIVGQFFKPMGIAFVAATLLSLFVSFTVTPMLAARWYRRGEDVEHPTGRFALSFEHRFTQFSNFYRRILAWSLDHRWFVLCAGFVVLVSVFMFIGGSFAPDPISAAMTGAGPMIFTVVIGLGVLAINALHKKVGVRAARWMFAITYAVGLVALLPMIIAKVGPVAGAILGAIGALAAPAILLGLISLILNAFGPVAKSRLVGSALLFGLAFPMAAMVGFGYAQWKKEAVFKFAFMPPSDGGTVAVSLVLPPGSALKETEKVIAKVENVVKRHPDVKYILSDVGRRAGGGWSASETGTNYGQVRITLNDKAAPLDKLLFWVPKKGKLRTKADTEVSAEMLQLLGRIPGVDMTVSAAAGQGFGAPIQMSFSSDDRQLLFDTASKIVAGLKAGAIKGVVSPEMTSKPGKPEIRAVPDRARLADADLTTAQVANTMRILYEGDKQAKLRVKGREYDIRVLMSPTDRNNPKIIEQLPLKFMDGSPVFLSQVARLVPGVGVDKIERRDRTEEIKLSADLLPGFAAGTVQLDIDKWLAKEKLIPKGVRLKPLGQADVQNREQGYLFGALGIALVLVYLLLASLFNNWLYPLVIQLAQPQAMVGALLALILTDKTLNIVGMVGIIALVGLVGKNAILVVDYTNTLRGRGKQRREALLEAGPTRLRPIMMTTFALILGMLPVALAIGRGSEFRETIGIIIIGGIMLSTMLTLLVIPCSYTIFDDLSNWWMRKMRRLQRREDEKISEFDSPNGEVDGQLHTEFPVERPGAGVQGD